MHEHMSTCSRKKNIESLADGEWEEYMASSFVKRRLSYTQITEQEEEIDLERSPQSQC